MERPNLNNRVRFADFLGQIIYPEGTPLGLYIVKKYIEEMHGKTSFTSQYQKGFNIYNSTTQIRYDETFIN